MALLNSGEMRSKKQGDNRMKWRKCGLYVSVTLCIEIIFSGTVSCQIPKIALVRYDKIKYDALFRKQCCNEQSCIDLDWPDCLFPISSF